jgi:hypothetical protein
VSQQPCGGRVKTGLGARDRKPVSASRTEVIYGRSTFEFLKSRDMRGCRFWVECCVLGVVPLSSLLVLDKEAPWLQRDDDDVWTLQPSFHGHMHTV